jgi:hypothetical protein
MRNAQYYYHLTGTAFYEPLQFDALSDYKEVWNQEFISENNAVKRFEYLAWNIFSTHQNIHTEDQNREFIQQFMTQHFGEGLVKGIHDEDALTIVSKLQQIHNELGLMRFTSEERALAQLFWNFLQDERKEYYQKQFEIIALISSSFTSKNGFERLNEELSKEIKTFAEQYQFFTNVDFSNAAEYLKTENRQHFIISEKAAALYQSFFKDLKEQGKDIEFTDQLKMLHLYPSACFSMAESALKAFVGHTELNIEKGIINEVAAFLISQNFEEQNIRYTTYEVSLKELRSLEKDAEYILNYYEFTSRLKHYSEIIVPKFRQLNELKAKWVNEKKKALKSRRSSLRF